MMTATEVQLCSIFKMYARPLSGIKPPHYLCMSIRFSLACRGRRTSLEFPRDANEDTPLRVIGGLYRALYSVHDPYFEVRL